MTHPNCDGCARGLPVNAKGVHKGEGGVWDLQTCTANRYTLEDRERSLREAIAKLPPLTERERRVQRLSFVYGSLACSTNHRPSRKALKAAALDSGTPEDVFEEWAATVTWERE